MRRSIRFENDVKQYGVDIYLYVCKRKNTIPLHHIKLKEARYKKNVHTV